MAYTYECPYFSYERGRTLCCEGCRMTFPDGKARWEHLHTFCCNRKGWQGCQHAQMLNKFYERTEDKKP